ncbi:hypothetical protein SCALM49S_04451 [Streptomyces californicus]
MVVDRAGWAAPPTTSPVVPSTSPVVRGISLTRPTPSAHAPDRSCPQYSVRRPRPTRRSLSQHGLSPFQPGSARPQVIAVLPSTLLTRETSSNHTVLPVFPRRVPQRRAEQATSWSPRPPSSSGPARRSVGGSGSGSETSTSSPGAVGGRSASGAPASGPAGAGPPARVRSPSGCGADQAYAVRLAFTQRRRLYRRYTSGQHERGASENAPPDASSGRAQTAARPRTDVDAPRCRRGRYRTGRWCVIRVPAGRRHGVRRLHGPARGVVRPPGDRSPRGRAHCPAPGAPPRSPWRAPKSSVTLVHHDADRGHSVDHPAAARRALLGQHHGRPARDGPRPPGAECMIGSPAPGRRSAGASAGHRADAQPLRGLGARLPARCGSSGPGRPLGGLLRSEGVDGRLRPVAGAGDRARYGALALIRTGAGAAVHRPLRHQHVPRVQGDGVRDPLHLLHIRACARQAGMGRQRAVAVFSLRSLATRR